MATIKSYTDINQSKKLAEILPLESADMRYKEYTSSLDYSSKYCVIPSVGYPHSKDIPCWSLAALLGVLPNNKKETTTLSRGGWKIETIEYIDNWWCEYEDDSHTKDFTVSSDNPVNACVAMIEKLNELKLL